MSAAARALSITMDLARLVPDEKVTRLECELGREAIERAVSIARENGVDNVNFVTGDVGLSLVWCCILADRCQAHSLPFNDATFDITYAHQILQHTEDPILAFREMSRVTKPSGYIAVHSTDFRGFTWYPGSPGLSAWRAVYLKNHAQQRQHPRLRPPPARLGPRSRAPRLQR